jgi:hypothetical protein
MVLKLSSDVANLKKCKRLIGNCGILQNDLKFLSLIILLT